MAINFDGILNYLPPLGSKASNESTQSSSVEDNLHRLPSWYDKFQAESNVAISDDIMNKIVMDYFISAGFEEAAKTLLEEAELEESLSDFREPCQLKERSEIRNAIHKGQLELAIDLVNNLYPTLLEKNPVLHFQILRQQLVELIREKKIEEALEFAELNLVGKSDQPAEELSKLERTYALLAFDKPESSPFGYLTHMNEKIVLGSIVNDALLQEANASLGSAAENTMKISVYTAAHMDARGESSRILSPEHSSKIAHEIYEPKIEDDAMEEAL